MTNLERAGLVAHVCRCPHDGMKFVWVKRETDEILRGKDKPNGWIEPPEPSVPGTMDSGTRPAPLPGGGTVEALALWRHKDGEVTWYAVCARCWDLGDEVLNAKWLAKRAQG